MKRVDDTPSIVVVAPDEDMRRSLAFLLSAEGFCVTSFKSWTLAKIEGHLGAVIIDHGAFDKDFHDDGKLLHLGEKVVVLVGRDNRFPPLPKAVVLRKPLLDHDLLDALHNVLAIASDK